MIDSRAPDAAAVAPGVDSDRRRRWWIAGLVIAALLLAGGMLIPAFLPVAPLTVPAAAPTPSTPSASPSVSPPPPSPSPSPATAAALRPDLLALPGPVPTRGSGKFAYAPGRGRVLGTKGELRRFRVAVERGGNEDVAAFAAQVEATLGDRRSWTGDGRLRLQRVSGGEPASFTVYLATRDTAGKMCRRGGTNITIGGRPHTSCRVTGKVIINLDRWRLSARPYLDAKVPLSTYRHYVVNHEVGHELGQGHQGCPRRGGPAPVMVQQTLTLRGCVPYAWPRRGDRRFTGPGL
ncbi:DUF3152 domain-containing protein [Amorphoplanes digitatis]|uniref:DUF3152 domain-containing protein n=1 Tax=Actinoplanes digitatis TaxID=1868 RepID=A0A7W7I532_9ACTN|nr:DUF3152 domain-containing protein [Actinoplanes digitatis]MBB4766620.1 hypothetical protein [Actinoplanes digitatis]GID96121.1 hypothetical protein Adi01nite_55330 [Actinoplanes digitatis]